MFDKDMERLVLLELLKNKKDSEWGYPYLTQNKPKSN